METNFKTHGYYAVSNWGGLEIEISNDGEGARLKENYKDEPQKVSRWQKIKYTSSGRAYVTYYGKRYYLDAFMKV